MILFLFVSLVAVNTDVKTKLDLFEFPVIFLMLFLFLTIEWLFQSSFHPSSKDLAIPPAYCASPVSLPAGSGTHNE